MNIHEQYLYYFTGFSLNTYLIGKGLDPDTTTQLSIHMASQLLHDIGVAPALLDTQCDRESLPYHPSSDEIGWNKGNSRNCIIIF